MAQADTDEDRREERRCRGGEHLLRRRSSIARRLDPGGFGVHAASEPGRPKKTMRGAERFSKSVDRRGGRAPLRRAEGRARARPAAHSCGTRDRPAPPRAADPTPRRRRAQLRALPRPPSCAASDGSSSSVTTYEPSGRCSARSVITRHSQGAKHDSAPVWQTGPAGRTRRRIVSPSQSSRSSSTASVLPEVSPLRQ